MSTRDLGSLTAYDLGATVTLTDGGSTHTGVLESIDHSQGYLSQPAKTFVRLTSGDWRHFKHYPSVTPCEVTWPDEGADDDE